MKIYIAGKISQNNKQAPLDMSLVKQKFTDAEKALKEMGYIDIVNPLELEHKSYHPFPLCPMPLVWEDYMRGCLKALCECDALYLLPCWEDSTGATLELKVAQSLNLKIIHAMY